MLILSRADVEALLDPNELIDALVPAMADLSAGSASVPPRIAAKVFEPEGFLAAMPAYLPSAASLETKLVTLFPHNADLGLHTHQAVIVVFDSATGTPLALMDGTHITAERTAAGSALATRLLAREELSILAILGTGVQARTHARAIPRVRRVGEVRVAGRNSTKAHTLAKELARELPIRAVATYAEALAGADIVCATTLSPEPVVRREWLNAGTHVNSVGVNPQGREVDAATIVDALVVVESRRAVLESWPGANELLLPIRDGLISPDHIHAEVGELASGKRPGRTSPEQITLYKSVGVAAQDAAAAALVLGTARARGRGTEVKL